MFECGYLHRPKEGIRYPGARVTNGCEVPDIGSSNQVPGPLEEQQLLLTAESSLFQGEMEQAST